MALNRQAFKTRTLTAIVFAIVMLAGLLWNPWSFLILFSVIHFGCWVEYQKLVELIDPGYTERTPFHKYGVMIAGWCLLLWFTGPGFSLGGVLLHQIGWWLGLVVAFILPMTEILFTRNIRLKNIAHSFFGLVYISLPIGLMMDLYGVSIYHLSNDETSVTDPAIHWSIPIIIIGSIWINDTMAYIVGSLIGKTPFSKISPKKTWEGTLGGIVMAVAVVMLVAWLIDFNMMHMGIIAVIASVAGVAGDLFESKLKRLAGVKDSGTMMPGHGGFLDRFDSMLFAIPFVWLYVEFFIK
jgi:phosphatidate cytidylyltransferase